MSSKRIANPLLGGGSNFNLEESFGIQPAPALLVPSSEEVRTPSSATQSSIPFSKSSSPAAQPPELKSLGPPPPGLFLLDSSQQPATTLKSSSNLSKPKYVPPPGIHPSNSATSLFQPPTLSTSNEAFPPPPLPSMSNMPPLSGMSTSASVPNFVNVQGPELYPGQHDNRAFPDGSYGIQENDEPLHHWYFKFLEKSYNVLNPTVRLDKVTENWKPFSMRDSMALEECYQADKNTSVLIPTDGGRCDVDISCRKKYPVYWKDGLNDEMEVCRSTWFYKLVNTWVPYEEKLAERLEDEFQSCLKSGQWKHEVRLDSNESIRMISPNMMYHLPSEQSSLVGKLDEWGQVQPPSQDPSQVPREVRRGCDGIIDDVPDGEDMKCDHLVFVIHGIGGACDMKFRPIHEVVDTFRELTNSMSKKHFQRAHLTESVTRIEFLPINWHTPLHGEEKGTDERLRPMTLKSIPKLRNFVNDTLLDILFYTSPIYCQKILDTVVSEINRIYTLFCTRNEDFNGKISIIGHSLGSLITFDLLSNQSSSVQGEHMVVEKPKVETELTLEQVFNKLEINEYTENFTKEGIDMDALFLCTEDDLKEGGLPIGPRKKLLNYLEKRKALQEHKLSGLEEYHETSITSDVKYRIGPAGTGQPSVFYPKLDFEPSSFYALGSPIALFHAVRGISELGPNFQLPTCPKFFNIFHPYDPVAYRIESLICKEYAGLRPVTIPHHQGRKRMHLELKETVTKLMTGDLKKKLIDSVWSGLSAIYNTATGYNENTAATEERVNEVVEQKLQEEEALDIANPTEINSKLNEGQRIDYCLQEAPYESFNEYVFALGSHLCYWDSEDTILMVLKDIYSTMGVISDEQLAMNEASASSVNQPAPYVDNTPTAILRPASNVPIGSSPSDGPSVMASSNMPSATSTDVSYKPPSVSTFSTTASTLVPPGFVPQMNSSPMTNLASPATSAFPPPPIINSTPVTSFNLTNTNSNMNMSIGPPPPISTFTPSSTLGPPPPAVGPVSQTIDASPLAFPPGSAPSPSFSSAPPSGPPPSMMSPTSFTSTPQIPSGSGGSVLGRPRRAAYPTHGTSANAMGMDPTAPSSTAKVLGPPPTAGFMR